MLSANRRRTWLARIRHANFDEQNPGVRVCGTLYDSATASSMQALHDMSLQKLASRKAASGDRTAPSTGQCVLMKQVVSFPGQSALFPLVYHIGEMPKKNSCASLSAKNSSEEKDLDQEFRDALRDLSITWLTKLQGKSATSLFEDLKEKNAKHVPLLLARIQSLDTDKKYSNDELQIDTLNHVKYALQERSRYLSDIVALADEALAAIDTLELLAALGTRTDKKDNNNNKQ
ncbi:hypothetical protein HPB52_023146 [Rhipicephalus sanguineus]|uniref:Tripeptidyl peptidase II C-terminal domain-containing protein n=1 Tax=Rhipicephalus sanguineus TaxID=34632 RepID=A0A9D4T238_RHISA|nr:hypothetical protein HPB52_023146 [Rhipicephalus sanguineus]